MSPTPPPAAQAPGGGGRWRRWWAAPQLQSVLWQALGSAATLGAALWVSWRFGLAAQGEFGLAKSWFDAAAVIASLGLPQGLLHVQYRRQVPAGALWPWLRRGLLGAGVLCALAAAVAYALGATLLCAVLAALPLAVGHLLARSLLLHGRGVVVFGVVTAMPALLVLAGVLAMGLLGEPGSFTALLFTAALLAGTVSLGLVARTLQPSTARWPHKELWTVSLQSWLQAALGGLLAAGLLSVVAASGQGDAAVGAASLGLHLYQLFAVLAGYAAPLLFDRLARQAAPTLAGRRLPRAVVAMLVAAVVVALAAAALAAAGRAPAWLLPLGLMLPAGLAAVAARVHGTVLLARSDYLELSRQAAWRLGLALVVAALALHLLPAAAAVALALLVTETATWWRAARRSARGG